MDAVKQSTIAFRSVKPARAASGGEKKPEDPALIAPKNAVWKPTKEQIAAAAGKTLEDVIAPGLSILFVGINPSLYSAAIGHHFGRPGNRFWRALHLGGLTPGVLSPFDERELLSHGIGITDVVDRATKCEDNLSPAEKREGAKKLAEKIRTYRPKVVAFVGMTVYRDAFGRKDAAVGLQKESLGGRPVWILPSTSGLNANYQLPELAKLFGEVKAAADSKNSLEIGPDLLDGIDDLRAASSKPKRSEHAPSKRKKIKKEHDVGNGGKSGNMFAQFMFESAAVPRKWKSKSRHWKWK
ncbi:uracil-DNA glycosylase-like protein [Hyaloraphidium curvatum]|nr:uracil-DNA glycosylase-like protein [Hyaloraphidium curvatum]